MEMISILINKMIGFGKHNTIRGGVIIQCGSKFLCVLQKSSKFWGFPKGRIEPGECLLDCMKRELYEETKINLSKKVLLQSPVLHYKNYWFSIVKIPNIINCKVDEWEISNYNWLTLDEIEKLSVSNVTSNILKKIYNWITLNEMEKLSI